MKRHSTPMPLPEDQCAIVTKDMETLEIFIPDYDDNEPVPEIMMYLTAVFIRYHHDTAFYEEQINWAKNQMDRMEKSQ